MRAADIVQMDPAHCSGLLVTKKIAAMAEAQDIKVAPHCSIGPVVLCAVLHVNWSTSNVMIQENFGDYDVPCRHDLVYGWNPVKNGEFALPEKPGLGIELNTALCAEYPYKKNNFHLCGISGGSKTLRRIGRCASSRCVVVLRRFQRSAALITSTHFLQFGTGSSTSPSYSMVRNWS